MFELFKCTCLVLLVSACSGKPGDEPSVAATEPAQIGQSAPQADESPDALHAGSSHAGSASCTAEELQNIRTELAEARRRADEQQDQARQATEEARQAHTALERLTRELAALRRAEAGKARALLACQHSAAEVLATRDGAVPSHAEPGPPLTADQQAQACNRPEFLLKRSDVLN